MSGLKADAYAEKTVARWAGRLLTESAASAGKRERLLASGSANVRQALVLSMGMARPSHHERLTLQSNR
jgi:hypothetical protein